MYVYLSDSNGHLTAPKDKTVVNLAVTGGSAIPASFTITPGTPKVPAAIVPSAASVTVSTSTEGGLQNNTVSAKGCNPKPVGNLRLKMKALPDEAKANGQDPILVLLTMVDDQDTLAADQDHRKDTGFQPHSVAEPVSPEAAAKNVYMPAGECEIQQPLIAHQAGRGSVSTDFGGQKLTIGLIFRPVITIWAATLVLLGGLLGGFASAARNYTKASRWGHRRWCYWLISATVGAVALYLANIYGLLRLAPDFPSGVGFALLSGLVGGFLGAVVLERLGEAV